MRDRIDPVEAIRLYRVWQNWREVAKRMFHNSGVPFAHDAVQKAVRRYDRQERTA
jgi:hypothetical protein